MVLVLPIRLGKDQQGSTIWGKNRGPGSRAEGQLGMVGQAADQGCARVLVFLATLDASCGG